MPSRAVTASAPPLDLRADATKNGPNVAAFQAMVSSLTQAEILIALVVAAHAGVLAVRLAVSLYKA